ncbi:MAG TPA: alpha/beta hydrolase [Solirubrobacteraceae bacterium]|jgi:pimeloyl-ACP methyl ester carboxylesterase|nr:alpha/beta hydrolase [Solirubrobacteraceae bacterium]
MSATTAEVTQLTAPNLTVEAANGVSYAYRQLGEPSAGAPPLVLLQHFRGNLDNWDPELVDALARTREVILFDNAGVGGSTGTVPRTITAMAHDALSFTDALELHEIDMLGFSLGGYIAQELVLIRPRLVRRLVLAGTGPQGGEDMHGFTDEIFEHGTHDQIAPEDILTLFFARSETSVAKGREFIERIFTRTEDRDTPAALKVRDAQMDAVTAWGIPDPTRLNRLAGITQPVLVANGDNDRMVGTKNSYLLAESLPNARLKIYPDAAHAFLFQYPVEFAGEVDRFLKE